MTHRPDLGELPRDSTTLSYSGGLRRAFNIAAIVIGMLPIPIAILHLLPAYRIHARLLAFLTPVVCLLTLAYLFYLRDSLARIMFAHLLDPLPAQSRHYRERGEIRKRRLWARARRGFLAFLPALLLLISFACMARYSTRLGQSMAMAAVRLDQRAESEDVALVPDDHDTDRRAPTRSQTRDKPPATGAGGHAETLDSTSQQQVLGAAVIAGIPYFAELTALYVGSFLAAVLALALMGFREYAKEALGLSERDVVLGRVLGDQD